MFSFSFFKKKAQLSQTSCTMRHLGASYARIQLFRLKGAQRKLKTDRCKIERLTPNDLRKRYQISNKFTLLYTSSSFDPLYSLSPMAAPSDSSPSVPGPTPTNSTVALQSSTSCSSFQTTIATSPPPPPVQSSSTTTITSTNTSGFDPINNYSHYGCNGGVVGGGLEFAYMPPNDSMYSGGGGPGSYSGNMTNGFGGSLVATAQTALSVYSDYGFVNNSMMHFNANESASNGDHYYGSYETYSNMGFP